MTIQSKEEKTIFVELCMFNYKQSY